MHREYNSKKKKVGEGLILCPLRIHFGLKSHFHQNLLCFLFFFLFNLFGSRFKNTEGYTVDSIHPTSVFPPWKKPILLLASYTAF